jgi:hypothetical protein
MEIMRAISFFTSVGATAVILFLVTWAIISPRGWTKKDNYGVAVRFKVFLPLYLQNPNKWKLMPDKVMYDNVMTVYFSSGHQWRKYNRWRKRVEKERMKRQQEERKQRFMDLIFKDYQTEPNPEFTPPPTVKPKANKDKLTNAELDKIRADLTLTAQAQEKQDNPRCKDCVHMKYMQRINSERFDTVCVRHITSLGFEYVWSTKAACGLLEPKTQFRKPMETVQTHL